MFVSNTTRLDKGAPIIFVPPPMVGSFVFYKQAIDLSRQFRVILMELRGHAGSDVSKKPLSYPIVADDICHLMDSLNLYRAVVAGYSMGGQIALEFARRYPERAYGIIPISAFSEVCDARLRMELSMALKFAQPAGMQTLALALAVANADSRRALRNMYLSGMRCHVRNVADLFGEAIRYRCSDDLSSMRMPIQLVFGEKDRRLLRYREIFRNCLPQATQVVIPGAHHQVPTRAAETLNEEICRFLRAIDV
nr:alpha/beta hydrolase [Alicyclobacillus suci]